jgi:uncharacterized protein YcbK (DUF882 family)
MCALILLLTVRAAYPPMVLYHVNFQKELRVKLYDDGGHMQRKQARRLEELLRCHHSGKRHHIDSRLMQLLYRVSRHWEGRRIEVVSGYRDRKFARTRHSAHTQGKAVDFRVDGVNNEALRDYVRTFRKVGVGYYPNSSFVHMDVRDKSAFWIDYSGPGEDARYSEDAERDLKLQHQARAGTH